MFPSIKFQLIWGTLDFRTKFAKKNMNDKILKKINIKIIISM